MTNPNDPAHPQHGWSSDAATLERMKHQGGLTKRELFAAMAMQGLLSSDEGFGIVADKIAHYAVEQANALIAELSKEVNP